ncbi:MAG: ribonuclease III [Candidatus Pacebacteria bacterium]|nr:ribonuclease III [Candidatus Paceibacterota bacterium]
MQDIFSSFKNKNLLTTALTHRSALNEQISDSVESNERLEFLGDAVLELATTRFLFDKHPMDQEGLLTAYRSALVKTETLAETSLEIGLGKELYMSKGEEATGGRSNIGILADSFEALLGAMYLDQGYDAIVLFLEEVLFPKLSEIKSKKLYRDGKSLLQEVAQAEGNEAPQYKVITAVGPDHDKEFTVAVFVADKEVGRGTGRSKQHAQQSAARQALEKYDLE